MRPMVRQFLGTMGSQLSCFVHIARRLKPYGGNCKRCCHIDVASRPFSCELTVTGIRLIRQNSLQIFRCICSLRMNRPESDAISFSPYSRQNDRSGKKDLHLPLGHDRGKKSEFTSPRRSDTLLQHQSDPQHHSNLIPPRGRIDDINRANFAARTTLGRCDGRVERQHAKSRRLVSTDQLGASHLRILHGYILGEEV